MSTPNPLLGAWSAEAEAEAWRRVRERQARGEFSAPSLAWGELKGLSIEEPTAQPAAPEPSAAAEELDKAPAPLRLEGLKELAAREVGATATTPATTTKTAPEQVDHPAHYHAESGLEVIDIIEAWALNYNRGNALKYLARAGRKDPASEAQDLKKALWYIERELKRLEEASA